jgi:aldehyde:ferredoxin oxidoreductase
MPYGYNGKILHVDLSGHTTWVEEPGEKWYRTYVGGSGLAAYYLLKEMKSGIDALAPDNVLVFACSVVTGVPVSGFSRYSVAAKSPLTGGIGKTEAGGYFGPELKFAGFDAVVIKGKSPAPVYLWIHDGEVEIRKAGHLWGKNNWQTLELIRKEHGDRLIRVASIGQAGENLVRFANVQNDLEHFNGRTGMGAVMGSKNLKAIAARGHQKMRMAQPEKVKEFARWHLGFLKSNPPTMGLNKHGTPIIVDLINAAGMFTTRNFKYGVFKGADKINAEAYANILDSSGSCYACCVRCKRRVASDDEKYPLNKKFGGPEYETLSALGSLLENDNLLSIARGNQLCNLHGMDTISAGGVIAFAMECYEQGIITKADTGGKPIRFGSAEDMLWLLEEMAHQRGIGKILSQGVRLAAKEFGPKSERFAFHIKGQEIACHDGRGKTGMALGFALCPTGADHIETLHDSAFASDAGKLAPLGIHDPVDPLSLDEDKVRFFFMGQKTWGVNNCYGICNYCSVPHMGMDFAKLVEIISAITGWETSLFEILMVAERANVMARIFNNREGFGPGDDRLIRRWHQKMPSGALQGRAIDRDELEEAIKLYYQMSGWDQQGRPQKAKLVELDLKWLIAEESATP